MRGRIRCDASAEPRRGLFAMLMSELACATECLYAKTSISIGSLGSTIICLNVGTSISIGSLRSTVPRLGVRTSIGTGRPWSTVPCLHARTAIGTAALDQPRRRPRLPTPATHRFTPQHEACIPNDPGRDIRRHMKDAPDPVPALKRELAQAIVLRLGRSGQFNLASRVGVDQPRASDLERGRLERFSLQQLVRFAARADGDVRITVTWTSRRIWIIPRLSSTRRQPRWPVRRPPSASCTPDNYSR